MPVVLCIEFLQQIAFKFCHVLVLGHKALDCVVLEDSDTFLDDLKPTVKTRHIANWVGRTRHVWYLGFDVMYCCSQTTAQKPVDWPTRAINFVVRKFPSQIGTRGAEKALQELCAFFRGTRVVVHLQKTTLL